MALSHCIACTLFVGAFDRILPQKVFRGWGSSMTTTRASLPDTYEGSKKKSNFPSLKKAVDGNRTPRKGEAFPLRGPKERKKGERG